MIEKLMKIPKNITLAAYIRRLIAEDKVELFYQTDEWKDLREKVLQDFHFECQECLKRGKYTRAICVHHVNEVRHRPELALSRHYVDSKGNTQANLVPLCNQCHNIAHPEKGYKSTKKERFCNEERW